MYKGMSTLSLLVLIFDGFAVEFGIECGALLHKKRQLCYFIQLNINTFVIRTFLLFFHLSIHQFSPSISDSIPSSLFYIT